MLRSFYHRALFSKSKFRAWLIFWPVLFLGLFSFFADLRASEPPRISNVEIIEIEEDSALVRWQTDQPADSLINYGLDHNYGQVRDPDPDTTEHEMKLDQLLSGTTYYFRIVSRDSDGNQVVSGDFQFKTDGTPEVVTEDASPAEQVESILEQVDDIEDIEEIQEILEERTLEVADDLSIVAVPEVEVEEDHAIVSWSTNRPAYSRVEFEDEYNYDEETQNLPRAQSGPEEMMTEHEVRVTGLIPDTEYHFQAVSEDQSGVTARSGLGIFKTRARAPAIQDLFLEAVGEDFAVLEWSTSVPAESLVEYENLETGEVSTRGSPSMSTNHSVRLAGLEYGVQYEARVMAIGQDGSMDESEPIEFRTEINEDPPSVSNVSTESTLYPGAESRVQTIISWDTDQLARCHLHYQQGLAAGVDTFELEPRDESHLLRHVQVVVDFRPATVYQFWMVCEDRFGNEGQSETFVVFTPQQEKNIIDIIMENFEGSFGWLQDIFQ